MAECIEREAAIREIEQINPVDYGAMWDYEAHHWAGECLRDCKEAIDSIPAADVAPVVYGRWEHLGGDEWCCSACGFVITTEGSWDKPTKKYCEDCGAKMDGERKGGGDG